jgi:hypothetical protein
VVVLGVLDRWRLPDRAERGPNLAQDQRSEAVGNLLGNTERGAVGCAGTGSRLGPSWGDQGTAV